MSNKNRAFPVSRPGLYEWLYVFVRRGRHPCMQHDRINEVDTMHLMVKTFVYIFYANTMHENYWTRTQS